MHWHIGLVTESQDTRLHSAHILATKQSGLESRVQWTTLHGKVYQTKGVGELHECIVSAWDGLDQRVIDTAYRQWQTRLHSCINAKKLNIACPN